MAFAHFSGIEAVTVRRAVPRLCPKRALSGVFTPPRAGNRAFRLYLFCPRQKRIPLQSLALLKNGAHAGRKAGIFYRSLFGFGTVEFGIAVLPVLPLVFLYETHYYFTFNNLYGD
jgi:hypothetical protein